MKAQASAGSRVLDQYRPFADEISSLAMSGDATMRGHRAPFAAEESNHADILEVLKSENATWRGTGKAGTLSTARSGRSCRFVGRA